MPSSPFHHLKFGCICLTLFMLSNFSMLAQKTWEDDGVTITKLDTLEGFEALRGSFVIENTNVFEIMNLIIDVDGYDWVEGESVSKMLSINRSDSSFTFDFFVDIPWLFLKKTGRARVDIEYRDGKFSTKSTQLKNYEAKEDYDVVDFYSAQWQLEMLNEKDVQVTYLGVYQDVKMLINLNGIIVSRIRKRLNGTFQDLREIASNKSRPANRLAWPSIQYNNADK